MVQLFNAFKNKKKLLEYNLIPNDSYLDLWSNDNN